jgi:exonuclease III
MASIRVGTLNCRGLNSCQKQHQISNFVLQVDVLFLQETNIHSLAAARKIEHIFGCKALWSFSSKKSTGAAILLFNSDFSIDKFHFDIDGRLIFLDTTIDNLKLRFINVYTPVDHKPRIEFLSSLYMYLGTSRKIILGGDWNCVLNTKIDKIGGNSDLGTVGSKEILAICKDFNLVDPFRHFFPNSTAVTWHSCDGKIHCRLDRFYVSKSLIDIISCPSIVPATCAVTDHDLVVFTLSARDPIPLGPGFWKLNNSVLSDSNLRRAFVEFWKKCMTGFILTLESWDSLKEDIKHFFIEYSKKKFNVTRNVVNSLRKKYSALQKLPSASAPDFIDQINSLRDQISGIESQSQKGAFIRSKCNFLDFSEKPSKFFVIRERYRSNKKMIKHLVKDGRDLRDNDSILDAFREFYIDLFKDEGIDDNLMNDFLFGLPVLSPEQAVFCDGPISSQEILSSLGSMQNHKSPGSDGLTKEFYITFFDILSPILVQLYGLIFEEGVLTPSQRLSYISLICKNPDQSEQMKNWRPISLLNYDYKILSKTLTMRLSQVMDFLVHPDQASGVRGRSILDNCHLLRNIYDYVTQKKIPCAWVNLDFLKAFDRISWGYMFNMLRHRGFNSSFISWIHILYNQALAAVLVNNHISHPFGLSRGVRQGCAISPLLFVLCLEPLAAKVRAEESIVGLSIPGQTKSVKQVIFADDFTGVLVTNRSIEIFLRIVKLFCRASGSALNLTKTNGFFLGKWKSRSDHPFGISWPDVVKLLGIKFGASVSMDDVWNPIYIKFSRTLNYWRTRQLTLKQKSVVIMSSACSKLWVVYRLYLPNVQTLYQSISKCNFLVFMAQKMSTNQSKSSVFTFSERRSQCS